MPIMFNLVLRDAALLPADVALVRHQDNRANRGRTPYDLWLRNDGAFDLYQSHQVAEARKKFTRPYWASFVGTPEGTTLFIGLYAAVYEVTQGRDANAPQGPAR